MSFSSSPVVIFPASSRSGAQAANLLLSQGLKVRAVPRNLSKLESLKALGAEIVQADPSQPESIKSALQDAQALYFVNPTPYDGSDMFKEAQRVAQLLMEALEDSSVKRVVHVPVPSCELFFSHFSQIITGFDLAFLGLPALVRFTDLAIFYFFLSFSFILLPK